MLFSFVIWSIYISVFMNFAYPYLPEQFGGGQPRQVQLLVAKDDLPIAKALGISFQPNALLSDPIQLVYEGDKQYILRTSEDQIVQLDKDSVSGLVLD